MGYDLSQTRLQAIAASLGIQTAVSNMTQAEKAQLRYYAIMTQVTTAQGDMARTLSSPANQLRILSASATQAGRAIGNAFIPILNAVLPVAIAAARAIRAVAAAIASLFGYTLPSVDFSVTVDGLGGISDGMDDIASGAGNAGGAAEKLKSILMGFDEINQLQDPTGGGGGRGGGGGGGGSMSEMDFALPEYDFLADMISTQVDAIYRKMAPFINWVTDNLNSILAIVKAVGGAFLSWKLAKSFMPDIGKGIAGLKIMKGILAGLAVTTIMIGLVYDFDTEFLTTGDPWQLVGEGISTLFGSMLIGEIAEKTVEGARGYGASIGLAVSAATTIAALYNGVTADGWKWDPEEVVTAIWGVIKGAAAGAVAGFTLTGPSGAIAGAAIGATLAIGITAVAIVVGLGKKEITDNIKWGEVRLEADGIANIINRMFNYDVSATIDIVDTTISNEGEARAALNTTITRFNTTLLPFSLNMKVDENDVNTLKSQAETLISAFKTEMEARKETVNLAITLVPHQGENGTDTSAEMLSSFMTSQATLTTYMDTLGQQLADALNAGLADGAFDQALISELSTKLVEVSKAVTLGTAQGEFNADVGLMLSDLTEESFGEVVAQYSATVDDLNESLTEIETAAKAAMQGQLAGLETAQDQLIEAGDLAGAAELQTQIDNISTMLANWDIAANVAQAMQAATAPMREQWAMALQKVFGGGFDNLLNTGYFDPFIIGTAASWDTEMLTSEFEASINSAIEDAIGEENTELLFNVADALSVTGFDLLGADIQQQLYDTLAGAVGETRADEVFANLGLTLGTVATELTTVSTQASEAGDEIATSTGAAASETEALGTAITDASSAAKTEMPKIADEMNAASETIAGAGAQIENLQTKIVEIPTDKAIQLTIVNYSSSLSKINAIGSAVRGLSGATINLKVKAGLTAGAKNFLKQLKELDSGVSAQINRVLNLSQFASGGYPRSGELFIANENGRQEMVGRIGNKAAVANQDQIGDAIFKYMDAHTEANGGIDTDTLASSIAGALKAAGIGAVYLDGRMLASSINKETQRSGRPAINY